MEICPKCYGRMYPVSEYTKGFSIGKAALGAIVAGPMGVAAGALGKKKILYQCSECGFTKEIDYKNDISAYGEELSRQYCGTDNLTANNVAIGKNKYTITNWEDVISIDCGLDHVVGLQSNGRVLAAGSNNKKGECNVEHWEGICKIAAKRHSTFGIMADGSVVATGDNAHGQCNVAHWRDINKVFCNIEDYTVGLTNDGKVLITDWVDCDDRDAFNTFYMTVTSWSDIVSLSNSDLRRIVGVKSDGTVVVATSKPRWFDEIIRTWKDIVSIYDGVFYCVGFKADGTVEVAGELCGKAISTLFSWEEIEKCWGNTSFLVALKSDGTIRSNGEIASNKYLNIEDVAISRLYGLTNVKSVSVDGNNVVFLKKDGSVVLFGRNEGCDVVNWSGITDVASNYSLIVGLKADGTVVATGRGNTPSNTDVSTWASTPLIPVVSRMAPIADYVCPKCGHTVHFGDKFCSQCAQAFDWSKL